MSRSYAISVDYAVPPIGRGADSTTMFLTAKNEDLAALLRVLDQSVYVASYTVCSTITVPDLHVLSKLTCSDLGIEEHQLFKLR